MLDTQSNTPPNRIDMVVRRFLRNAPEIIAADQPLPALGMTSLDMVNLMLALEAEFDVTFPPEKLRYGNFASVANILRLLESLGP